MVFDPIMISDFFGFPRMGVASAAIVTISRAIYALTLLFIACIDM